MSICFKYILRIPTFNDMYMYMHTRTKIVHVHVDVYCVI